MRTVTVYSSAPLSISLAIAFYKLSCLGLRVVVKPISELPPIAWPIRRRSALVAELEEISLELATLEERLLQCQQGQRCLGTDNEQELLTNCTALQARQEALVISLRKRDGSPD